MRENFFDVSPVISEVVSVKDEGAVLLVIVTAVANGEKETAAEAIGGEEAKN